MFLFSCTTMMEGMKDLHPENVSVDKTIITKKSKLDNHDAIVDWIALNFNNSNEVLKVNDKERGKIILKGLTGCTISNGGVDVDLMFHINVTVVSTDKKVVIEIPNIVSNDGWDYPRTDEQVVQVRNCIEKSIIKPVENELVK